MINWFTIAATKLPNVETHFFCKLFGLRPTSGPCYQRMEFPALSDYMFRESKLIKFNTFSCWLVPLSFFFFVLHQTANWFGKVRRTQAPRSVA